MAIDKIFNDGNVDGIADNIFNAVNNSVSEVKQMQQRKAAENAQMVVQSLKKIDTDIREKYDNVTDVLEKRIITIKDGRDGINGKDGRDGKNGKDGRDGKDGKTGPQGPKGQDGIDGLDGISVANANIDFDGSLIIALSNGQEINVGEVVSSDLADKIQVISTMSTNGAVGIKDEGSSISTGVKNINFVGAAVTATNSGDDVTVNVSAGTGTVTSVAATVPTFLSVTGSPVTTSGTLAISLSGTALPVANGGTGITSFGTGVATFLGTPSSANLAAAVTDETGTGALVFATSPTLVTPILGTPTSGTLTNATGLPISTGVSGLGTGVATALAVNVGSAGAPVVNGGALGTPSSGTVTNLTGTASININGTVGATTASSGAFTTLSATGVTTVQAGTAALPAITTTGDTNTGIFFPAADTIAFSEGGVESMRINSSGQLDLVNNPILTGGTANGVAYLNGSKVLTTGSALVFDATNLSLGTVSAKVNFATTSSATVNYVGGSADGFSLEMVMQRGASQPLKYKQDYGVGHVWSVAGSDKMTLDTSGNLGIGTTSPASKLNVVATASTIGQSRIEGSGVGSLFSGMTAGSIGFLHSNTGTLAFGTSTTDNNLVERARIDSSGRLLVNSTTSVVSGDEIAGFVGNSGISAKATNSSANFAGAFWNNATSGDNVFLAFLTETGGTQRGGITYNRAGGLVAYNTTSDYRAKDISGPVTGSGALIDSIPVYMGTMKGATQERPMFIAHETPAYAHTGVKDAVDADGNPVYQQMDASALIPVMWAEIQELRKRLAALESN